MTVFGDLAPDQPIDGPTLTAILAPIGIKPEATRVALHRLRADGWIVSDRTGRISRHKLSQKAQADSERARPRIYGPAPADDDLQLVLMRDANTAPDPDHFALITPRLYASRRTTKAPSNAAILPASHLPAWFVTQAETDELQQAYAALHTVLKDLQSNRIIVSSLSPVESATLRVMIVHAWRRLALKHPLLPSTAHSPEWQGYACRTLVIDLLNQIARPSLGDLKAT